MKSICINWRWLLALWALALTLALSGCNGEVNPTPATPNDPPAHTLTPSTDAGKRLDERSQDRAAHEGEPEPPIPLVEKRACVETEHGDNPCEPRSTRRYSR